MENNNNDNKLLKFLGKVAIGVVAAAVLTPLGAIVVGGYTYGATKCMEHLLELDEEEKEVFSFISDCGKDIAFGGVIGGSVNCLIGPSSSSLASQSTKVLGREASKEIAVNGVTTTSKALINTGKVISTVQKNIDGVSKMVEVGNNSWKMIKHQNHLKEGIDYLKGCEICNE